MNFPRNTIIVGKCIAMIANASGKFVLCGEARTQRSCTIVYRNKTWRAPRLSYHLNNKKITRLCRSRKIDWICHTCDNTWCINPKHIYLGTARTNIIDTYNRHPTVRQHRAETTRAAFTPERRKAHSVRAKKIGLSKLGNAFQSKMRKKK